MSIRRPLAALTATVLTAVGAAATAAPASAAPASPRGDFIVVLADDAPRSSALQHARALGGRIGHTYTHVLNGFSVELPEAAAERLARRPGVVDVEPVVVVQARPQPASTSSTPWGLDRIDQRTGLNGTYSPAGTGVGVTAYVVDTGIHAGHQDLSNRVRDGVDLVDGAVPAADCNGHGTHVAGTIGGEQRGVAPDVALVAVRVLDCTGSGYTDDVIAGLEFVAGDHLPGVPAVANLSLGSPADSAVDTAVQEVIDDGVTVVVAAGNGNAQGRPQDACGYSPARVPGALTVAATDRTDTVASFSNYGTCVDLYAPGVSVLSDWYTSPSATNTISGTSMASPHVAGAAAVYLQSHPAARPSEVAAAITASATPGVVKRGVSTTPNRLLFAGPALVTYVPTAAG
ncbi:MULTISPECIES: S8 family peptidase [unclassified Blastococcus]